MILVGVWDKAERAPKNPKIFRKQSSRWQHDVSTCEQTERRTNRKCPTIYDEETEQLPKAPTFCAAGKADRKEKRQPTGARRRALKSNNFPPQQEGPSQTSSCAMSPVHRETRLISFSEECRHVSIPFVLPLPFKDLRWQNIFWKDNEEFGLADDLGKDLSIWITRKFRAKHKALYELSLYTKREFQSINDHSWYPVLSARSTVCKIQQPCNMWFLFSGL